jgi:hypothetical protein
LETDTLENVVLFAYGVALLGFIGLTIIPIRRIKLLSSRWGNFGFLVASILFFTWLLPHVYSKESLAKNAREKAMQQEEKQKAEAKEKDDKATAETNKKLGRDIGDVRRNPEDYLRLQRFTWTKGGFDSVAIISGRIRNTSSFEMKDVRLECEVTGESGSVLSRDTVTIYKTVAAGGLIYFSDLSLSFINQQSSRLGCDIVDAEVE